eukprot:EG_transcript_26163
MEAFPPPPPFWVLYADGPSSGPQPPLPPANYAFSAFGVPHEAGGDIPSLEELSQGRVPRLLPDGGVDQLDCKAWLRALLRTLLGRYLALLDATLAAGDALPNDGGALLLTAPLLDGLQHVFLNMSHLLNSLRPRVAREDLLRLMEEQATRREALALSVARAEEEVQNILSSSKVSIGEHASTASTG